MRRAGQLHGAGGVALDANVHAAATEPEVVQRQRFPAGRQQRRVRLDEPGIADAQAAEAVQQALQVAPGAGEEIAGVVAGRFGAYVEGRLERAAWFATNFTGGTLSLPRRAAAIDRGAMPIGAAATFSAAFGRMPYS